MPQNNIVFEMNGVSKSFPGVKALNNVSIKIQKGSVHALMGENGAGKSTLVKCAFGIYQPNEGEIKVEGEKVQMKSPVQALNSGIAMIHQELHPIKMRNVMENIWIGRVPLHRKFGMNFVNEKKMYNDTLKLLQSLDININPKTIVKELSPSQCQLIEVARSVSYGAKVIIMDEPTSTLTIKEVENLFKIIEKLKQSGTSIIYISHKMDEILQISDEVSIMRDGEMVGTWVSKDIDKSFIIKKMVGREIKNQFPDSNHEVKDVILKVKSLTSDKEHSFKNVSFDLHRGEVLGIGGLVGAQRSELIESIFGLRKIKSGYIELNGKKAEINRPVDAIKNGMALLTEERRATGIIPMLNITENTVLAKQSAKVSSYTGKGIFLKNKLLEKDTKDYIEKLNIKTPGTKTKIQFLSGGNQQKVILGRWMLLDPDILILDEPTRGIDVGAKYEIYCLIEELTKKGKSIIMISSEMPELIGMSDRIMVMCEGRATGILQKNEFTEENIMRLASGIVEDDNND